MEWVMYVRDRCAGCRPQDLEVLEWAFGMCANSKLRGVHAWWKWVEDGEGRVG
jgi:hypothetical protein